MGIQGKIEAILFGAMLAAFTLAASCSKGEPKVAPEATPPAAAPPPTSGYVTEPVTSGGSIKGTVTYVGSKPSLPAVRCARDPDICGRAKPNQTILLGPGGTLKNVIVSLTDIHAGKAMTTNQARLDIKQCAYLPRVQAVAVKSSIMVTNGDLIPHDLGGSLGTRSVFNRIVLLRRDERRRFVLHHRGSSRAVYLASLARNARRADSAGDHFAQRHHRRRLQAGSEDLGQAEGTPIKQRTLMANVAGGFLKR
jgi:hypothetical protein